MLKTIIIIRFFFITLSIIGAWLIWFAGDYQDSKRLFYHITFGILLGALTVLVDIFLKGFSLRGLTALTFGLAMGSLIAYLLSVSPLFEYGNPEIIYQVRLILFVVCMYLGTVVALRGRDEFNLVIPYVRFIPRKADNPAVVLDTSALIDGRVVGICKAKFLSSELVIPRFVLNELQTIADSADPNRQERGRKGLQVLNELRKLRHLDITIYESELTKSQKVDEKLIFVAESLNAKLLTTDYNLAKLAEFQGIDWLNLTDLAKVMRLEIVAGEQLEVDLVKNGKEPGQAIGFLDDGSMVVVNNAVNDIGHKLQVEVSSVIPSAGGKMIFATKLTN